MNDFCNVILLFLLQKNEDNQTISVDLDHLNSNICNTLLN